MKIIIGIDNGTSGTIAILKEDGTYMFFETPIKIEQSYTKTKQNISRIDLIKLKEIFINNIDITNDRVYVYIERPMVNPGRFKATLSAMRSLEATLILCEELKFSIKYCDSKIWQGNLLPKNCKKEELKVASMNIACRIFPKEKEKIIKHKDGDSLLIAENFKKEVFFI